MLNAEVRGPAPAPGSPTADSRAGGRPDSRQPTAGRAGETLHRHLIRLRLVVEELRDVVAEHQFEVADRAVALLGDDDLRDALLFGLFVVDLVAVDEADDVRVLLDRP